MAKSIIGFVDAEGFVHSIERGHSFSVSSAVGGPTRVTGTDRGAVVAVAPDSSLEAAIGAASAQRSEVVTVDDTDSPYSVASTDRVILVDTTTDVVTVQLPAPAAFVGLVTVKDIGDASSNNITVARADEENVNGAGADLTLSTQYASATLCSDGTDWWVVD